MDNKGQTTVFFSLIISVLLFLILSALEVTRIHMSNVKISACVHSMRSSFMADYDSMLFERYHLMFLDPTYGTGSEALAEEKISDYLEISLNGEDNTGSGIYQFTLEEIALTGQKYILDDDMKQVKEQIIDYEKTAGLVNKAKTLLGKMQQETNDIKKASQETELNGVELEGSQTKTEETETGMQNADGQEDSAVKVEDPRDKLQEFLKLGVLDFVLPDGDVSKEEHDFSSAPSAKYKEQREENKDTGFQDISFLKAFLKESADKASFSGLEQYAAFLDYVCSNFSNAVNPRDDSVMKCEIEYILKGKGNDYDNLQGVVNELTWMRMPVNYAYLLTDTEKKSEALTLAAAICTATGTGAMMEVVKYLLLGCWAYGETLYEMRCLLEGNEIAYMKTNENWNTDLESLISSGAKKQITNGLDYEDYLMLLLAKKSGISFNTCCARMLDMIELNLQKDNADFVLTNCVGGITIQGKISVNSLFDRQKEKSLYEYYFEEEILY